MSDQIDKLTAELRRLQAEQTCAMRRFSEAVVRAVRSGIGHISPEVAAVHQDLRDLKQQASSVVAQLEATLPAELLDLLQAPAFPPERRFSRSDILNTPPAADFDEAMREATSRLIAMVDADLVKSALERVRLGDEYLATPLEIIGTKRVLRDVPDSLPRLYRALACCLDYLNNRDTLDFWSLPMLAAEVTALGLSLDHIPRLGPVAIQKFNALEQMVGDDAASVIFELLVGIAFRRANFHVGMLEPSKSDPTPDFGFDFHGIPAFIECKRRRADLFLHQESKHARELFDALYSALSAAGHHVKVEAEFSQPIETVDFQESLRTVLSIAPSAFTRTVVESSYGAVSVEILPYDSTFKRTRLYSPDFLNSVFGYDPDAGEWDGLICRVDRPDVVLVKKATNPICLAWRSCAPVLLAKKARGLQGTVASAISQVLPGSIAFIYVAYEETARGSVADQRTDRIIDEMERFTHKWGVFVPLVNISRIYARPLNAGIPDMIENVLHGWSEGEDLGDGRFPSLIYTQMDAV